MHLLSAAIDDNEFACAFFDAPLVDGPLDPACLTRSLIAFQLAADRTSPAAEHALYTLALHDARNRYCEGKCA